MSVKQRQSLLRLRLRSAFAQPFRQHAERLTMAETGRLLALLRRMTLEQFLRALRPFYADEFQRLVTRFMQPIFTIYGEEIAEAAATEIGAQVDDEMVKPFVPVYSSAFTNRRAQAGRLQLETLAEGAPPGMEQTLIERRLNEWQTKNPAKIAVREVNQLMNGMTKTVWALAGVLVIVWRTVGPETCPYCRRLEGRAVQIQETFIPAGGEVAVEGRDALRVRRGIGHPPLHGGCDCFIAARL